MKFGLALYLYCTKLKKKPTKESSRNCTLKTATKEDYQRLIDIGQLLLKSTQDQWPEIPVERIPFVRFGQGLHAMYTAVGHLMLGDLEQSRAWFRTATEYFLEADKPLHSMMGEFRALECAIFCGDTDFRYQIAHKILPRESKLKPAEYPYTMLLKHTLLDEQAKVLAFVDEAVWKSRNTLKKRGGYAVLQEACTAFAYRQPDRFTAALVEMLREHKMKASHGLTKVPDGMICFPGAALLILAREAGLTVAVTSPFIPAALLN